MVKEIFCRDRLDIGLVAVFRVQETRRTVKLRHGENKPRLVFAARPQRVLYYYCLDANFELIHLRLQTWFPYIMQVYVNGHDGLARQFAISEAMFREVTGPRYVGNQRASALKFGEPVVFAMLSVLLIFRLLPCGFRSRDFREQMATLLGEKPSQWTQGRITYQLRRLRLHGLMERREGTTLYTTTQNGYRTALWFTRCHGRLPRPKTLLHQTCAHGAHPTT